LAIWGLSALCLASGPEPAAGALASNTTLRFAVSRESAVRPASAALPVAGHGESVAPATGPALVSATTNTAGSLDAKPSSWTPVVRTANVLRGNATEHGLRSTPATVLEPSPGDSPGDSLGGALAVDVRPTTAANVEPIRIAPTTTELRIKAPSEPTIQATTTAASRPAESADSEDTQQGWVAKGHHESSPEDGANVRLASYDDGWAPAGMGPERRGGPAMALRRAEPAVTPPPVSRPSAALVWETIAEKTPAQEPAAADPYAALQRMLAKLFPESEITLVATDAGLLVEGRTRDAARARQIMASVRSGVSGTVGESGLRVASGLRIPRVVASTPQPKILGPFGHGK